MQSFKFTYRNPGHWDVVTNQGRAFAIRGEPGEVFIRDERLERRPNIGPFKTLASAVAWVTDELMYEAEAHALVKDLADLEITPAEITPMGSSNDRLNGLIRRARSCLG